MRTRILMALAATAPLTLALLVPAPPPAGAATWTPDTPQTVTIPDVGAGTPYPASLARWGMSGPITDVNVQLRNLSHTFPSDLDIVVVSPEGTAVMLMSDACGNGDLTNAFLTFDDEAPAALSNTGPCSSGTYQPTDVAPGDVLPPPSPPVAPGGMLAAFDGENPSGAWRLFVADDAGGDSGSLATGFRLIIETQNALAAIPTGDTGAGISDPWPVPIPISGKVGKVADVDLVVNGLSHTFPGDLELMLVGPDGQHAAVMSDQCGGDDVRNVDLVFDDEAMAPLPPTGCGSGSYQPVLDPGPEMFPDPAPAGPYTSSLSAFDGTDPNGTWQLYVLDDATADSGYLVTAPTLRLTMDRPPTTKITKHPQKRTAKRRATFKFVSSDPGSTFRCKVDKKPYRNCTSPQRLRVKPGKHTFRVFAVDQLGQRDATPAKWTWKVRR